MTMKKIKVATATGLQLDWLVAGEEGLLGFGYRTNSSGRLEVKNSDGGWGVLSPTTIRDDGGPISEREGIDVLKDGVHWTALKTATAHHRHLRMQGPTPLVAAMRCFVASRLGDTVEVPEELL